MFNYKFTSSAEKKIRKIPKRFQKQIFNDLESICPFSHPLQSVKVLKLKGNYNEPTYRLRSGDYRVIFRIENKILFIASVHHRQEGY
jgi:mRNA-degrading endonuclease RelE of RelBE toxin-antitoxin system